jgi:hypothetical protein
MNRLTVTLVLGLILSFTVMWDVARDNMNGQPPHHHDLAAQTHATSQPRPI